MPRSEVAESYDNAFFFFLVLWGTSILFSIVAVPIYIPTNSVGGFLFLHILSSTCYFIDFNAGCSDWC